MALTCPNKNNPDWKLLEERYPDLAYFYWNKYEGNIPPILLGKESKGEKKINYHRSKPFEILENEFKEDLEKTVLGYAQSSNLISKRKSKDANGKHHILITAPNANWRMGWNNDQKLKFVQGNLSHLEKLNKRNASPNGKQPYIITPISNDPNKKDKLLYSVEVNPDYLTDEWGAQESYATAVEEMAAINANPNRGKNVYKNRQQETNHQKETSLDTGWDTLEQTEDKVMKLSKSLPMAKVIMNSDLPPNVYGRQRGNVIEINPRYVKSDTAIHEFGHLFVDLLGGMDNNFIKRGRRLLNGTDIEAEVIKQYGHLEGDQLDKEIIVTAVGIEGAKLYTAQQQTPFLAWIKVFFNKIRLALGLKGNVALELANQMLNDKVDKTELTGLTSNVWQYSQTMNKGETSKETIKVQRIINKILERVSILQSKYKKVKASEQTDTGKKLATFKEQIKKLLEEVEKHQDVKGLLTYVDEMDAQANRNLELLDGEMQKLNEGKELNGKKLKNISDFMGVFEMLSDVRALITSEMRNLDPTIDADTYIALRDKRDSIAVIQGKVEDIKSMHDELNTEYIIQILKPYAITKKVEFERKYQRDFYRNNPGKRTAQKRAQMEEYVAEQMEENADMIEAEEISNLRKNVETMADDDITSMEAIISDPRSLDDNLIAAAVDLLDQADYKAMRQFLQMRDYATILWEELRKYKDNPSDQKKLYEGIIEKVNGKETGFLVGKYTSQYMVELNNYRKKWDEMKSKGIPETKAVKKEIYEELKRKHRNPQWDKLKSLPVDNPTRKMYDYLTEIADQKDKAVSANGYKLEVPILEFKNSLPTKAESKEGINERLYRLPAIEKTTVERVFEQGLGTATVEGIKDILSKDTSYTEAGELSEADKSLPANIRKAIVDEKGRENQSVPIHYRGKLNKGSQQSFDLVGMSLIDYNMVRNYAEKSKVAHTLEILEEHSANRKVRVKKGGKYLLKKIGSSQESYVDIAGVDTNTYKALRSLIQDRLYGISTIDMGDVNVMGKSVSLNKVSQGVMAWTGHTMLMFNWVAGGVNLLQGKYQNFLEGATGKHYDRKHLRKAEVLYARDSKSILGDIGEFKPNSKTNLLVERLDAFADFSGILSRYSNNSKVKRMANTSTGHFINHMGEHYIQSTLMYAILDKIKVKGKDGTYVPMHEAYEVVDGKLQIREGFEINEDQEFEVSKKIKETVKMLHGNYDNNNQALAQRTIGGKFGFMLRKWMIVGTQRRWRGLRHALKDSDHFSEKDIPYSRILEEDVEGYYTTSVRFMREVGSELLRLKFGIVTGKWNELTDKEQGNIRKTIIDASTLTLTIIAANLLAGLAKDADDEDKEFYYSMAYIFRRHYSEVSFYANPVEGFKLLQTPAASVSMIDKTFRLISQLTTDPTERYQRGARKGQLKINRKFKQVVPIFGQLDRQVQDIYEWLERE